MKIRKRFPKYQIKDLKLMKKLILFGLCMFLLVSFVSASWQYQEDANETACGGNWDDVYVCTNIYDGDWDNYGRAVDPVGMAYIYINYTKLDGALNSSLWEVKDGSGRVNLTINNDCWGYDNDKIIFRINSTYTFGPEYSDWYCLNSSGWGLLRHSVASPIYEEAIWWNTTEAPPPPITQQFNITSISKTSILIINKGGMLTISK